MTMNVTIRAMTGPELVDALPALALLCIRIFAEWPYLYDGDLHYEANYLREFSRSPDAVIVTALDGGEIVGAATGAPMSAQSETFRRPFEERGMDVSRLFYFGESVLLEDYRGRRIGHTFFELREAQARRCAANAAIFATVVRPDSHPQKPEDYAPLDGFWMKRGYRPIENMTTALAWPERGIEGSTLKTMQYWRGEV